jgi:two-component system NtrC family sensor kinase
MRRLFWAFFGGRLRTVLVASFVFVAIVAAALNTLVISRVINDYLTSAQEDRVSRDMDLADGLYQEKLREITGIAQRTASDLGATGSLRAAIAGDGVARNTIDRVISRNVTAPLLGGSEVILVLDGDGNFIIGRSLSADGQLSEPFLRGNWGSLPVIADAFASGQPSASTEVIPAFILSQVGLQQLAHVPLRETAHAAPDRFSQQEGTAGLTLISAYPVRGEQPGASGMVVAAYLFNNDSSFVDYLVDVAKIETTTVFLGDLRVSTNVLDENGQRAIGTRVSQAVYDAVLTRGQTYFGRVFVVKEWYIGSYQPLRDHRGHIIGMLYVGARDAAFRNLLDNFTSRAVLIAIVCILIAGILALPISRWIAWPIRDLVQANRRLAGGDMSVRVDPKGEGEFGMLGRSFNNMVETLTDTQEELLRKDKLASVGQLAAGVAHELNNPLGTILLYSDAMLADAPADDPRREDLEMIIDEAQRCKVIVADLLNFARQHELMAQEVDLNRLLDETITKVSSQPRFEQIEIRCQLEPQLPLIRADAAQLQQVFINLLNNSADAIEGPGVITLQTRSAGQQFVEARVSDTGSGIPAENLGKLFLPFFTTKPAGKGTGLGLAIAYGIVKMHRGQIHVESQVGHGTTFTVTLPVRAAEAPHAPAPESDIIA